MTQLGDTLTDLERRALDRGLAYWHQGRLIPVVRGGDETDEEKAAREAAEAAAKKKADEEAANKTFTQAELDRIVQDRLARERQKYEGYDDLKAKAEQFDKLQDEQKSELEKERERAARAEQEREKAIETANRRLIEAAILAHATTHKALKPEHLHKLIDTDKVTVGDDGQVTGAEDAVKAFLEANPEYVGNGRADLGSGDQGARGGGKQLTREDLKTMSSAEIVKARQEGRLDTVMGATT